MYEVKNRLFNMNKQVFKYRSGIIKNINGKKINRDGGVKFETNK